MQRRGAAMAYEKDDDLIVDEPDAGEDLAIEIE